LKPLIAGGAYLPGVLRKICAGFRVRVGASDELIVFNGWENK